MKINSVHQDVIKFIKNLDAKVQAEIQRMLDLLEEKGFDLRMPYSKKILKDLYELRITGIQNIRIFFTFHNNEIFLLHAITKKTKKLSRKDIAKAINRRKWLQ
jgi:phage-related protein